MRNERRNQAVHHRRAALSLSLFSFLFSLFLLTGCGPGISEQRRTDYLSAHPETNATTRAMIQDGRVAPGMTKDQVLAAWGSPPPDCHGWHSNLMEIWDYCQHPGRTLVVFDAHGRVSKVYMP
jgi:hypothetical protein